MATIAMNKAMFLERVANYETNPQEWKFLGNRPALIDFHATWCGPCKALGPTLEELADDYAGRVDIYKVDVDQESELAEVFQIRSVPTLIFVPMQGQPKRAQGAYPKNQLKELIDSELLK